MSNSKILNVTGLWRNQSKDGKNYLAGTLGNMKVMIFPNSNKKTDKSPDYTLCFAPIERKEKDEGASSEATATATEGRLWDPTHA